MLALSVALWSPMLSAYETGFVFDLISVKSISLALPTDKTRTTHRFKR